MTEISELRGQNTSLPPGPGNSTLTGLRGLGGKLGPERGKKYRYCVSKVVAEKYQKAERTYSVSV